MPPGRVRAVRFGQYELIEPPLGRGGMGVVYRARHQVLGTSACVKLLLHEYTRNAMVVERFINEARAAAQLDSEHVVGVLDCAQAADGTWYIVLEYLDGVPLSKWLRGRSDHGVTPRVVTNDGAGATDQGQIARILLPVAGALHAAHEAGIVHRDVKPDNVMLVVRRVGAEACHLHPVLLDFGIAKMRSEHGGLTRTGAYLGTIAYMAPEQFGSAKFADRRTDVYALGALLFQMVTGGFYVWADADNKIGDPGQVYYRQVTEPPPDPRSRNPAVSPAMSDLVRWALACDPRERCPSAIAFGDRLAELAVAEGKLSRTDDLLRTWAPTRVRTVPPAAVTLPPGAGGGADLADEATWRPPTSAPSTGVPTEIVARPEEATRRVRPPPIDEAGTSLDPAGAEPTPAGPAGAGPAGHPPGDLPAGARVGGRHVAPSPAMPTPVMDAPAVVAGPPRALAARQRHLGLAAAGASIVLLAGTTHYLARSSGANDRAATVDDGVNSPSKVEPASSPSPEAAPPPPTAPAKVNSATRAAVSVALLTDPTGAAVFVDDELVGTAPTKVDLAPGRTVRVRAELPGHTAREQTHTVADHADTVRLTLARPDPRPSPPRPRTADPSATAKPPTTAPTPKPFDPESLGH